MKTVTRMISVVLFGAVGACGPDEVRVDPPVDAAPVDAAPDAPPEEIEIAGRWASNFGATEEISSQAWDFMTVVEFSNADNATVTQNPPDDEFNPDKFNKIVWTEPTDGRFFYCFVDFGRDTAEEAANTPNTADDTDPENSGCGGFAWTRLDTAIEIHGTWSNNFAGTEEIDSFTWNEMTVVSYDNRDNATVTQNPSDDPFNPDKFNKIVWTEPDASGFHYCFVDFGLDTAEQAENSPNTADDSDPDSGGCGEFPWTRAMP